MISIVSAVVLIGQGTVFAEDEKDGQKKDALIPGKSEATLERLGELDSRIEVLKKIREIRKLEQEIKETEEGEKNQQGEGRAAPSELSQKMQQQPPGQAPMQEGGAPGPQNRQGDSGQDKNKKEADFKRLASKARVVSVSGFDNNVRAEIKLPDGGSLTVKKGHEIGKLGTAKTISHENVVMEKGDKSASVPFSDKFREFSPGVAQANEGGMDSAGTPSPPPEEESSSAEEESPPSEEESSSEMME